MILVLFFLLSPMAYQPNLCELAAKDFYRENGGDIIFANPINDKGYVLGDFNGHWFNKISIDGQVVYIDYQKQRIMNEDELYYHLRHKIFGMVFKMWNITVGQRPSFKLIERCSPWLAN